MVNKIKLYMVDRRIIFALFLLLPILSFINFPAKYTIISFLFIFCFFYYAHYKTLRKISTIYPLLLWLILTIYQWANAIHKKVPDVDILDLFHGLKIYTCIAIFIFLSRKNFDQTVKSLLICFQIYLFLSFFINSGSESDSGRLSGLIVATQLGQTAAMTGIYIAYYTIRNNISIGKTVLLYVLPIAVIIFTQSRNSLAMIAICILGHALAYSSKKGTNFKKTAITLLIMSVFLYGLFGFIINNTNLGARLADTETAVITAQHNSIATGTIFDKIVGDRLIYYVKGWQLFKDSPWTGIGMWNYEYLSQGTYPLHTEYMVQLAEGGIIAAVIWVFFFMTVFKGVLNADLPQHIKIIAIFSLIEILFCGIYARLFYYEFFYPIIGIALSFSHWGQPKIKSQIQSVK